MNDSSRQPAFDVGDIFTNENHFIAELADSGSHTDKRRRCPCVVVVVLYLHRNEFVAGLAAGDYRALKEPRDKRERRSKRDKSERFHRYAFVS
jgi:hypothetical protein